MILTGTGGERLDITAKMQDYYLNQVDNQYYCYNRKFSA
jgi:hypothetical protein